jgi:hypothetical protein
MFSVIYTVATLAPCDGVSSRISVCVVAVGSGLRVAVGDGVCEGVGDGVGDEVGDGVGDEVGDGVGDGVDDGVGEGASAGLAQETREAAAVIAIKCSALRRDIFLFNVFSP